MLIADNHAMLSCGIADKAPSKLCTGKMSCERSWASFRDKVLEETKGMMQSSQAGVKEKLKLVVGKLCHWHGELGAAGSETRRAGCGSQECQGGTLSFQRSSGDQ